MYEKDAADDLFVDNSIDCICGHYALHGRSSNPGTGYLVRPASASVWDRYWHACVHCLRADCLANPDASHYSGLSGRKRSSPLRLCDAGRCPKPNGRPIHSWRVGRCNAGSHWFALSGAGRDFRLLGLCRSWQCLLSRIGPLLGGWQDHLSQADSLWHDRQCATDRIFQLYHCNSR